VQHGKKTVKLNRTQSHRDAMLANMAMSLFLHGKIKTTTPKAKALRPMVDRLISIAQQGTLHSKRQVARTIRDKAVFKKLFDEIVPQFEDRKSGFSRVMRAGFRKGDGAELALVELAFESHKREATAKPKKEGRLQRLTGRRKKGEPRETAPREKKKRKAEEEVVAAEPEPEAIEEPEEDTVEQEAKPERKESEGGASEESESPDESEAEDEEKKA
jgi:large subunit ribosomal protein L17